MSASQHLSCNKYFAATHLTARSALTRFHFRRSPRRPRGMALVPGVTGAAGKEVGDGLWQRMFDGGEIDAEDGGCVHRHARLEPSRVEVRSGVGVGVGGGVWGGGVGGGVGGGGWGWGSGWG